MKKNVIINLDNSDLHSFASRKRMNLKLAYSYLRLSNASDNVTMKKHANEVYQCHRDTLFAVMDGKLKVARASHCTDKFCPLCGYEKSRKVYSSILSIIDDCNQKGINPNNDFILITLTVPNVPGFYLRDTVDKMSYAYRKLMQLKSFKSMSYGAVRSFEVTYNPLSKTFHPHIHALISVKPGYFQRETGIYITHEQLLQQWRKSMGDNNIMQVNIKKVRASDTLSLQKSIAEVAKYPLKLSTVYKLPEDEFDRVISHLYTLKGSKFLQGNGVFVSILNFVSKQDTFIPVEDVFEQDSDYTYFIIGSTKRVKVPSDTLFVRIHWRWYGADPEVFSGRDPNNLYLDRDSIPVSDLSEVDYDIDYAAWDECKYQFEI